MFVKICGTTNEADALLSVAMGADAIGFIFAPSPRQVAPQVVSEIVPRLPPEVLTVGVFRDETPERVVEITHRAGLKGVQLHGHERPMDVRWIGERVPFVIKAFAAGDAAIDEAADYGAHMIMLDAPHPGSGEVFDWRLTEGIPPGMRLLLAGGLDPGNVAAAIEMVQPWGVDVCTGVEATKGHKDPTKLREFIAAAKGSARPRYETTSPDQPFDWADDT